ncbi:hypothetical protein CU254_00395 [Amycolatopsis sp. AA4]|uniref:hypothetical protein n=1 Tax=Actinomycetes TaxID=1760 RepID=UPI0001B55A0E|nr:MULTISPECIES: hypothetical protein [Actinomycetes]ATY09114.1 hypothetical protein CU254_00395 [Amycolatopsis sp. AA4]EFL04404.1 predicted protein [Streptomyces sp. AA4]
MTEARPESEQPAASLLSSAQEEIWLAQAPLGRRDPYLVGEIVVLTGNLARTASPAPSGGSRSETADWIVVEDGAGHVSRSASGLAPSPQSST